MRKFFALLFLMSCFFSCKTPEARKPVKKTSGTSFIKESAERNKKLIAEEEALITEIIRKDTLNDYIASESGFQRVNTMDACTCFQRVHTTDACTCLASSCPHTTATKHS